MKKILLLLVMSASLCARAQTYYPLLGDTTEWIIFANQFHVIHDRSIYIGPGDHQAYGDTLISGQHYKFFYQQFSLPDHFIREDTMLRKVWFLVNGDTTEQLLYDFSLNTNDSVYLTFPYSVSGDGYPAGWYHVDSIVTQNIFIGPRKHFYLSNSASPQNPVTSNRYYLLWIEGVGSVIHPAYLYLQYYDYWGGPLTFSCSAYFDLMLMCEFKDGVKQYWDSCAYNYAVIIYDSCHIDFPGGIEEFNSANHLFLSPNPAINEIKVQSSKFKVQSVVVMDMMGKRLTLPLGTGSKVHGTFALSPNGEGLRFDVSLLPAGIYFVRVSGEKNFAIGKFVKE